MSTATAKDRSITLRESDALRAMPAMNPQALIAAAIEKGASVETLKGLVELAKDLRAIASKEAFNEAISEFQRRCPPIKKNRAMVVPGRPTYRYADLGEILPTIAPLMGELGLSVSWRTVTPVKPNAVAQVCIVSHRLGHSEDSGPSEIPYGDGGRMNSAQAVGSAKTYAKRYSLCDVLGISPEDDDDAHGSGGNGSDAPRPRAQTVVHQPPPTDPDDPSLVAESETLFPNPEKQALIAEIKRLARNIPAGDKAEAATTYLGVGVGLEQADVAALADLKRWCEARAKR